MVTNFDYLKKDQKFSKFADVAISAEKVILLDPEACIINCRRAMEFAVKWLYSMDNLEMPYRDNLPAWLERSIRRPEAICTKKLQALPEWQIYRRFRNSQI